MQNGVQKMDVLQTYKFKCTGCICKCKTFLKL